MPNMSVTGISPFLPAKDYQLSRRFYRELGFEEIWTSDDLSVFRRDDCTFYLQSAYAREWADNLMLQLSVENLDEWWEHLGALKPGEHYEGVWVKPPIEYPWGSREIHLIDPSGVCWHIAQKG